MATSDFNLSFSSPTVSIAPGSDVIAPSNMLQELAGTSDYCGEAYVRRLQRRICFSVNWNRLPAVSQRLIHQRDFIKDRRL